MKRLVIILLTIIVLIFGGFLFWKNTRQKSHIILMNGKVFEPSQITIYKGDRIVFKNTDVKPHWPASDFHPTHGIYPEFDPLKGILRGGEWSFTFNKVGRWRFHDHLMPELKGVVTVIEKND